MKGKSGNYIISLRDGDSVELDGPGKIVLKGVRKNRATLLIDADDETNIKRIKREPKEVTEGHSDDSD